MCTLIFRGITNIGLDKMKSIFSREGKSEAENINRYRRAFYSLHFKEAFAARLITFHN